VIFGNINFFELFPYGHGGWNEQHPTKLGLEVYVVNALWLFLRWFVQYHTFPLITFDMLAHNHVATSIYVHYKVYLDAMQIAIITKKILLFKFESLPFDLH